MDESQLQTARSARYNNWGEREPIVCSDSNKNFAAMAIASRKDLSGPEKSAKYLYDITGCKGFEFVAFSNAKLERPTQLADNIILFPCFHNNTNGLSLNDPMVQASIIMSQTARYVYDGWLPIDEMRESAIRSKIRVLREVMSAFSIVSGSNFEWESKYPIAGTSGESHYLNEADIDTLEKLANQIDCLSDNDRKALLRSIGWLSRSINQTEPEAKFLFAVLSIESFATYIEENSEDNSAFVTLRGSKKSKNERRKEREDCIRETILNLLDSDATRAVNEAYFNCVVGIRKRLGEHLGRVMGKDDEGYKIFLFDSTTDVSLYKIRHTIAHGIHDVLSDSELIRIEANLHKVINFAKRYIWQVLHKAFDFYNSSDTMQASIAINMNNVIISSRKMYRGPVNMGLIYARKP